MKIEQNKVVELIYTLHVEGQVADQTTKENPLGFIFGAGYLLPKFEENILGLEVGNTFDFHLSAEEGYGPVNPEALVELPKNVFEIDGVLREDLLVVGNIIPMMNSMGGMVQGKVAEIRPETVLMDFNHPMAGKELHFTGEIVTVREATESELNNGLHGERAQHDCDGECCSGCSGCH